MSANGELFVQRQALSTHGADGDDFIAIDVGANLGLWTLSLLTAADHANMGNRIKVHAFEPVPGAFNALKSNLCRHGDIVVMVPEAVSSNAMHSEMYVTHETAGTNSMYQQGAASFEKIPVKTTTLDIYARQNNIRRVDFLKIDAEGHDMEVLLGAADLFKREQIMVCQFEYNHRWIPARHYLKDVFDQFRGSAYSVGKVTPWGIEMFSGWNQELDRFFEGNYVLLHRDAVKRFHPKMVQFDSGCALS
jgi:FkbM family methyltransferase